MVSVIYFCVCTHEPDTGVIAVTFCGIAVIPFAVKINKEPEMDISVICRITVYSHVRDAGAVEKHLAA